MIPESKDEDKYFRLCELTKGDYAAFLYDCDGTLADNMQAHKDTYVRVAADEGVKIDPGIVDEFAGYPIAEVVKQINNRYHSKFDPQEFERRKSDLFLNEFIDNTKPIGFVVNHLKANAGNHKIAVVSGSARKTVEKTLEVLGIVSLVDVLVCAGETAKGKPYPDPFLLAATKSGAQPSSCIVFEDGEPGEKAAETAGMKCIRVDQL